MKTGTVKEQNERAVADAFINWYNELNNTEFKYYKRGEAPDFVYRFENRMMPLEVTTGYYDEDNAKMLWENARGRPSAPKIWIGKEPDQSLINHINIGLTNKCAKKYPADCTLVMNIYPDITTTEELEALINQIRVPTDHPFKEIYLTGMFLTSSNNTGGYQCWKLV
jgi:hypothetical protein